jgi:predicted Zn-dependent protease
MTFINKTSIGLVLLASILVWACTTGVIPATGERRYLGFSWEQEQEIGKQASKEVAAAFGIYRDPKLQRYVEEVGQRVLEESHLRRRATDEQFRRTPITFSILDSPTVNAMAIPGGHIYATRGLLAHLNSEDQLAVVLAHEIGHITARHAARRAWQEQLGQGLLLGGAILGQVFGLPAQQLLNLGGTAAQLIFLRYSREDELEADRLSVEYSSLAGYDPVEATGFFRALSQMQEREGAGLPNFLSTHPNPGDRVQQIKELAAEWNRKAPRRRDVDPAVYLAAIEGIVLGDDPRQGFVERNVFYHPELRFRFPVPQGFRVVNQPTQVIMIENQQRAIMGFRMGGEKSLQAAVSKFLSQGGLKVLDRGPTQSDGLPAFMVVADAQTQEQVVRLVAYFVEHRGRVYELVAYTAPQAFGYFRNEFLRTMRGFADVNDPEILRRQPVRLRLERAARTARFRDLIPTRLPNDMRPEDLAILNQVSLDQEIQRGRILKFPSVS